MATDVVVPALGESISEAVISAWLKEEGEYVERDEEIVELETDKVTMPLPCPVAGVLKHVAAEGDTIEVGGVVAQVDESAKKPAGAGKKKSKAKGGETKEESASATAVAEPPVKESAPAGAPAVSGGGSDVRTTPVAQKLAEEHGVDVSQLAGTGPGGRVRERDVLAAISAQGSNGRASNGTAVGAVEAKGRGVRRERMSQLRQKIASRLVEAQQTAAMLTTFNECDMSAVIGLRSRLKDEFFEKHGVKLGFMSFFTRAACSALKAVPSVNAQIAAGEKGAEVVYHDYCDVAVAVGTEKGLVVPVIRNAESMGFAEIEGEIVRLAQRARDGQLTLEEMQGGTFTISNGGVYGSMLSTPILNPPQSGILGLHNIMRRPMEHPAGSGEIKVRPMMYLALSYDHRIVDGQGAVTFLKHVKECIEDPDRLLLGV